MFFENQTVWEFLKTDNRPVVLYGMGDACEKILAVLQSIGVTPSDIFASDEFVRGQIFHGYKVLKYSQICEKYDDCIVLVCFATFLPDVMQKIRSIAERYTLLAPYISMFDSKLCSMEFIAENKEKIQSAYDMLSDEKSKAVYSGVINYMISGKIDYLFGCESDRSEVFENIIRLTGKEHYLDLGAYDGDTISEFLEHTGGKYEKIIAFEPDRKNFKKLTAFVQSNQLENIDCLPFGIWRESGKLNFAVKGGRMSRYDDKGEEIDVMSIDELMQGDELTYIKMDVEGAEFEALCGGKDTIAKFSPKLAVSAYHKPSDLFVLIPLIKKLNPNYKIFLRHHPYIPAFETNIYCCK